MAKNNDSRLIIWPEYFDAELTRAQGRRVPRKISVSSPSSEEIFKVCRKLGLSPEMEPDKAYPSRWFKGRGRVRVEPKESKTKILRMIGKRLARMSR